MRGHARLPQVVGGDHPAGTGKSTVQEGPDKEAWCNRGANPGPETRSNTAAGHVREADAGTTTPRAARCSGSTQTANLKAKNATRMVPYAATRCAPLSLICGGRALGRGEAGETSSMVHVVLPPKSSKPRPSPCHARIRSGHAWPDAGSGSQSSGGPLRLHARHRGRAWVCSASHTLHEEPA